MEEKNDLIEETKTLTASLDNTQKNATNTDSLVKHVGSLSGQTTYEQVIAGIIEDKATDWETKVPLIEKINSDFDKREEHNTRRVRNLQSSQARNTDKATRNWGMAFGWIATGVLSIFFLITPQGKKMATLAKQRLLAATTS